MAQFTLTTPSKRNASWLDKLESELLSYPHGAHDDVIDALAYMEQLVSEPYKREYMSGGEYENWNRTAGKM